MDMFLKGFLLWNERRNANNIIISDKGHHLSDAEAKSYARWGVENGYNTLKEMPEFEEVKEKLIMK